jgi:hypothetical protein
MLQFFKNGGFGMFPILALGLALLVTGAAFARSGRKESEAFLERVMKATLWASVVAFALDLMTVGFYVSRQESVDSGVVRIVAEGFAESLSPVVLGGGFLMIGWIFVALGRRKVDQRLELIPRDT